MGHMNGCRLCGSNDLEAVIDLGRQPFANSLWKGDEIYWNTFPLVLSICNTCSLGQLPYDYPSPFNKDYPYLSSQNQEYKKWCDWWMGKTFSQNILEIASNDGYLLDRLIKNRDSRDRNYCLGVDPAELKQVNPYIPVIHAFYSTDLITMKFSLIFANNVLAHVPDLDDILKGIKKNLDKNGQVIFMVPSLEEIIKNNNWDTIYHEHYSYFTRASIVFLAKKYDFSITKLNLIPLQGGSWECHLEQTS